MRWAWLLLIFLAGCSDGSASGHVFLAGEADFAGSMQRSGSAECGEGAHVLIDLRGAELGQVEAKAKDGAGLWVMAQTVAAGDQLAMDLTGQAGPWSIQATASNLRGGFQVLMTC